jgi:alanyl-tRNA synthetase
MKLTDFDNKPIASAQRALKEHYGTSMNVSKMSYAQVRDMLSRVRGLMSESKQSKKFYESQQNSSYMKLVFMEQALSKQFAYLSTQRPRIVTENEEVEKSQVVLAAQDLVDSLRKMIEEVSDMLVKELPALSDSIQSEIGVSESEQFNSQATEALTSLQATLTQSESTMKSALNSITGQGGGLADMGTDMGADMSADMDMDADMGDMDADVSVEEPLPGGGEEDMSADFEEPEEPVGAVGRAKR